MTPRITKGSGITGAIRYAMGEGRDPVTRELRKLAPGAQSRVQWYGGVGFQFEIDSEAAIDRARRRMEFDALNQHGNCRQDAVHLMLAWRPGEHPDRAHMEAQAKSALAAIGMENAKALFSAMRTRIMRTSISSRRRSTRTTGRAYDLKGNYLQALEMGRALRAGLYGGIVCHAARGSEPSCATRSTRATPAACSRLMTEQRATFTARELESALAKQIKGELSPRAIRRADSRPRRHRASFRPGRTADVRYTHQDRA